MPVDSLREQFEDALRSGPVVLSAPTGSGKSTRVPLWLNNLGHRVLVVEPRRVACRSLARFVARETSTRLGREVGYRHRHEDRSDPDTRILFATPGTALRMIQVDALRSFDTVILDEFHERHLQVDLLWAFLRTLRPSIRLVIMSATLDAADLAGRVGATPLRGEGRAFAVQVEHDPSISVPTRRDLAQRVVSALDRCSDDEGDVLVFLPGKAEIAQVRKTLGSRDGLEVISLHGQLRPVDQDRAFDPGRSRRVILSTNVAESAVTVPRIGVVVDSGLERRTVWRHGRSVLELCVISRSSADQRAGRAGRLGPGRAIRLWSEAARLEPVAAPEIHRVDLSQLVLECAARRLDPRQLDFPDPPHDYGIDDARQRLCGLGAIDQTGELTSIGRSMTSFPLDPPLARLMVEAGELGESGPAHDIVDLVASLDVGRSMFLRARSDVNPWPGREDYEDRRCDLFARIHAVRFGEPEVHGLASEVLREVRRSADVLRGSSGLDRRPAGQIDSRALAHTLLRVWPDCGYVPHRRQSAFGNGRDEVSIGRDSFVAATARAIVVADWHAVKRKGRTMTVATCASPVEPAMLVGQLGCERSLGAARIDDGQLVVEIEHTLAGRVVETRQVVATGSLAARAAAELIWRAKHLPDVKAVLTDDVSAFNLHNKLEGTGVEEVDPRSWLESKLAQLGVQVASDLDLLGPDDLRFEGLDEKQRTALDRAWPRRLVIDRQVLGVSYDPHRREVTLEPVGKARSATPPASRLLPRFGGYAVLYRDRGRVRRIR